MTSPSAKQTPKFKSCLTKSQPFKTIHASATSLLISRWVSPCRAPSFLFDVKKKRSKEKPPLFAALAGTLAGTYRAGASKSVLPPIKAWSAATSALLASSGPIEPNSAAAKGTALHLRAKVESLKYPAISAGFLVEHKTILSSPIKKAP